MKPYTFVAAAISIGFITQVQAGFLDKLQKGLDEANQKINNASEKSQETISTVNSASQSVSESVEATADSVNSIVTGSIPSSSVSRASNPYATPAPAGLPKLATGYDLFGMDLGYYTKEQLQTAVSSTQMGTYINDRRYQINMPAINVEGTELVSILEISANMPSGLACAGIAEKAMAKYINGSTSRMEVYSGSEVYSWGGSNVDMGRAKNTIDLNQFKQKVASLSGSGPFRLSGKSDGTTNTSPGMYFEIACNGGVTQQTSFKLISGKLQDITQYNMDHSLQQRKATAQATPTPDF